MEDPKKKDEPPKAPEGGTPPTPAAPPIPPAPAPAAPAAPAPAPAALVKIEPVPPPAPAAPAEPVESPELIAAQAEIQTLAGENTRLKTLVGGVKEDLLAGLSEAEKAQVEDIAQIGGGTDEATIRAILKLQNMGTLGKKAAPPVPEPNDGKTSTEPPPIGAPQSLADARKKFDEKFANVG